MEPWGGKADLRVHDLRTAALPLPAELGISPRLAPALHHLENNLQPLCGRSSDPRLAESVRFAWCLLAAQTPGGDGRCRDPGDDW